MPELRGSKRRKSWYSFGAVFPGPEGGWDISFSGGWSIWWSDKMLGRWSRVIVIYMRFSTATCYKQYQQCEARCIIKVLPTYFPS